MEIRFVRPEEEAALAKNIVTGFPSKTPPELLARLGKELREPEEGLFLGCFLDAYSSIALTIPVFYPAAVALGIDPMQFDLVAILALHMGGLTPPVGLCVYSVKAVAPKDVDVMGIFKGSMPYLAVMIVITLLFIFIPGLSTFIPNAMFT